MLAEKIAEINGRIADIVWGAPMLALLIIGGFYLTKSSSFIQIRRFGSAMKKTLGGIFKKGSEKNNAVTPFEAVCTALAGTIGTGNIAGVVIALCLGGPGAIFWMWVSAFIGMGIKYAEILLAVKYRERDPEGGYRGGPMYFIKNGLGSRFKWLAALFCIFGAVASFGIGNMMQMGSIMTALGGAIGAITEGEPVHRWMFPVVGLAMAAACAISIVGGAKRRGRMASFIVPFMAIFYIVGALAVICAHADRLLPVLGEIFSSAFTGTALLSGTAGETVRRAMSWGMKRGMFSNEAGLGSSPIAHASADTKSPVEQGFMGVFEVFFDTVVICTLTALMVLVSGVGLPYRSVGGAEYCAQALSTVFGDRLSSVFMAAAMALFAFSSIVGWSLYGERCVEYLAGKGAVDCYRAVFVAVIFLSSFMSFGFIIQISDIMNALMILPNMTGVLLLSPVVKRETGLYLRNARK